MESVVACLTMLASVNKVTFDLKLEMFLSCVIVD